VLVADVGPLAEVGLAQHDHAGVAETTYERGVCDRWGVHEREGAGRRGKAGGVDVVLDQHRPPVQRRADVPGGAFAICGLGLCRRARVERVDRAEQRIDLLDPVEQPLRLVLGGSRGHRPILTGRPGCGNAAYYGYAGPISSSNSHRELSARRSN
jgi:hypothetical protein